MLLCIECYFDVEASHDILCILPSVCVEEYASEEGCYISRAVADAESVDSGVLSDRSV